MFSSCKPKFFAIRHIHYPVNPSSAHFHTDAVVPSSEHCRTETVLPPSENYCIETVSQSGDDHCIALVIVAALRAMDNVTTLFRVWPMRFQQLQRKFGLLIMKLCMDSW